MFLSIQFPRNGSTKTRDQKPPQTADQKNKHQRPTTRDQRPETKDQGPETEFRRNHRLS